MKLSVANIHYSLLLGVPIVRELLYLVQIALVKTRLSDHFWVSKRDSPLRSSLFKYLTEKTDVIFCTAWQLGSQLRSVKGKYILSYTGGSLTSLSLNELYDIQQALLFASSITLESLPFLRPLLPSNFPIWHTYIISVREPLGAQCDFIKQTINELLSRNFAVLVLSHVPQELSASGLEGSFEYIDTSYPIFFAAGPYFFYRICSALWERWIKYRLLQRTKKLGSPVCWCFDPDDVETFHLCPPNTLFLYDCVDYHTSLDPQLRERILKNKDTIVKKSQVVVANSQTLQKKLQKIRKDVYLVPQGFDEEVFARKGEVQKDHRQFFNQLVRLSKKSPIVTFLGVLSWRTNFTLLVEVIESCPKLIFCLPQTVLEWKNEDRHTFWKMNLQKLQELPNILWYPKLHRQEVNALLDETKVGIIPYDTRFEFNRYCFPMKIFEYLYKGIPILSTPIEELHHYREYVHVAQKPNEWIATLKKISKKEVTTLWETKARELCQQHSWPQKINQILRVVENYHYQVHA